MSCVGSTAGGQLPSCVVLLCAILVCELTNDKRRTIPSFPRFRGTSLWVGDPRCEEGNAEHSDPGLQVFLICNKTHSPIWLMLTLKLLTPIHMVLMKQIQPTPTASAWKHFFKVCSDIGSVNFPVTWGASWSPFLNPYNTRVMDDANCGSRLTNDRKACFFGSYNTGLCCPAQ